MPEFPDEYLHPYTTSLYSFVHIARSIMEQLPDPEDLPQFLLCGVAPLPESAEDRGPSPSEDSDSPTIACRAFVNAREGLDPPGRPSIVGDFDSIIGLTQCLPFSKAITWHVIPLFNETLTKNAHIVRKIRVGDSLKTVPLHRIPNYMVLKFDTRHQGRVFLPGFYSPNEPPSIPADIFPVIYNRAVLPAIRACSLQLASRWPLTYRLAERLSRDSHGHISPVSFDIPPDLVQKFGKEFLTRLHHLGPKFLGAFFEIEAKGVKGASLHDPSDAAARTAALRRVLDPLIIADIPPEELLNDWFVDVALEIHEPNHCLVWLKDGHSHIIQHSLPSLSLEQAHSLTQAAKFTLDPTAHLTSFAGFRLEPGRLGSVDHVSYLNVYTTDKAATYQLNGGIYRRRRCTDLLPNNIQKLLEDIDKITETFSFCGGFRGETQDGAARLEARVNIAFVEESLTCMPQSVIEDTIIAVPSVLWWTFKYMRMVAIYRVIHALSQSSPATRAWIPSLMLGASCIYMFNALIYRPSDDRAEQALAEVCAMWMYPDVDPADSANIGVDLIEEPAMIPCTTGRGLYFLSSIVIDNGNPRLPRARLLDRALLARLYGFSTMAEVVKAVGGGTLGLSAQSRANKARTANRKTTVPITAFISEPQLHHFDLGAQGITPHQTSAMTGEDAPMHGFHDDDDVEETLDDAFSNLWAQFPSDIIQCSPNHRNRSQPAYVHLSQEQRHSVTIELFKSFSLPFNAVYIRICQNTAQWRDMFFNKFFPPPGTALSSNLQNFRNCRYLNAYSLELGRLKSRDVQRVRAALWEQFNQLRWLPHAESDRMWPTRPRQPSRLWTSIPSALSTTAVNIVMNPRFYSGPSCILLADSSTAAVQTMADEDEAMADLYARVLVRQSDAVGDQSALNETSLELESIRRERTDAARPPPVRREESSPVQQATPAAQARLLRAEEEESSPVQQATPVAQARLLRAEEEESSPVQQATPVAQARLLHAEEESGSLSSPEMPRGRISTVPSFSQFARGLKRPASDDIPELSILLKRYRRPRLSRTAFGTPISTPLSGSVQASVPGGSTGPQDANLNDDLDGGEFTCTGTIDVSDDDADLDGGEFTCTGISDDDDDDLDGGEFTCTGISDDDDDDLDGGEFTCTGISDDDDDDLDGGEFTCTGTIDDEVSDDEELAG